MHSGGPETNIHTTRYVLTYVGKVAYSLVAFDRELRAFPISCSVLSKVPSRFRWVVEQTLREFFKAVQLGKDMDPSWKKQIYKVIARLDDYVPDYFKSQSFLDQLE